MGIRLELHHAATESNMVKYFRQAVVNPIQASHQIFNSTLKMKELEIIFGSIIFIYIVSKLENTNLNISSANEGNIQTVSIV